MQGKLQQTYRVNNELGRHGFFEGTIELSSLNRLTSLVITDVQAPDQVLIQVKFEFLRNEFGKAVIKGHMNTTLTVECQRCLEPMTYHIDQDFELLVDASDEEVESFQLDTVYCDAGELDVFEVVEDELILALPIILMHEEQDCNELWKSETELEESDKPNPFAVLSVLKGKTD